MKITRGLIAGAAVAGALAVSGSAFTAASVLPAESVTKGYGSQTITGVTATSVTYNTDSTGATITSVGLVLTNDTTAKTIKIAFNDADPLVCSGAGTFATPSTTYSCTVSQAVGTAVKFALVAS